MTDGYEIPTDTLTDDELADLEGRGVDTSGPTVTVNPTAKSVPGSDEPAPEPPKTERKPIPAPAPTADVVERTRQRVENQQMLEGSSYEHKDDSGKVLDKKGEVTSQ